MENLNISRKLIEEVLRLNNIFKKYIKDNNLIIRYRYKCAGQITNGTKIINLDTFIRLCKEWILNKCYHINTSEDEINNYIYVYKLIETEFGYEIDRSKGVQFDSKGYINNLLEACEWLLTKEAK